MCYVYPAMWRCLVNLSNGFILAALTHVTTYEGDADMKKKLLSIALALTMLCSLILPTIATQPADERLAGVTLQVKKTLDLNTDEYAEFYGNLDENLVAPTWHLEWSGESGSLSISATEDGKILNFYRRDQSVSTSADNSIPSFPSGDRESARKAAQAFLNKVLIDGETAILKDEGTDHLGATRYRFSGEILLNGLPAGLSFTIAVRCEDNDIFSFSRDDLNGKIMGNIPSAKAQVAEGQARAALRKTLSLRLEYVLSGEDEARAVLRYLPEKGDDFYVDAVTGKLVNLSEIYRNVTEGNRGMSSSGLSNKFIAESAADAAPSAAPALSATEQAGVDKLMDVLDRDRLDAKARAIPQLGLDAYILASVNYSVARENDGTNESTVTASLRYGRQVGDSSWRRTVNLDAKTGQLQSLHSSAWLPEEGPVREVDAEAAQKTAEDFLNAICPDQFGKTALYNSSDALDRDGTVAHSFTFAQEENGYFYTGNSFNIGVDSTDGSISSYEKHFDDGVSFDSPENILTADQAIDAWLDTYTVQMQYIQVPSAIDFSKPEYQPLMEYGLSYLYELVLGYALKRENSLLGIDAKTGQPVEFDWGTSDNFITYGDLSGHWAQEKIETLAQYGVGYMDGIFKPDEALTQASLLALLVSTKGHLYRPEEKGADDELYQLAYNMELLTKEERNHDAILTRARTVRFILDAAGYGPIASLEGIFRTSFADDTDIPTELYGYAALAQGLGVVSGVPGGRFLPNNNATRAEAAVMLYNLLAR